MLLVLRHMSLSTNMIGSLAVCPKLQHNRSPFLACLYVLDASIRQLQDAEIPIHIRGKEKCAKRTVREGGTGMHLAGDHEGAGDDEAGEEGEGAGGARKIAGRPLQAGIYPQPPHLAENGLRDNFATRTFHDPQVQNLGKRRLLYIQALHLQ